MFEHHEEKRREVLGRLYRDLCNALTPCDSLREARLEIICRTYDRADIEWMMGVLEDEIRGAA